MPVFLDELSNKLTFKNLSAAYVLSHSQACVSLEQQYARVSAFVDELRKLPIAISTDEANQQHYEVRDVCHDDRSASKKETNSSRPSRVIIIVHAWDASAL